MFKKPLWIILTVALILSLPSIWERMTTEWGNNQYEFIVPYEEVAELALKTDGDTTEILNRLKEAGVETVSLEPITLNELSLTGDIVVLSPERVREIALFSEDFDVKQTLDNQGVYIYTINETNLTKDLGRFFEDKELKTVFLQGKRMLYIPGEKKEVLSKTLGYSYDIIDEIEAAGLALVPRIPELGEDDVERMMDQIVELRERTAGRILPSGNEVFGLKNPNQIKSVAQQLLEEQYDLYLIEMFEQKGFNTLAYSMDLNVVRMHGINLEQIKKPIDAVNRSVRAVKERNIRSLFVRFDKTEPEKTLEEVEQYLSDVQQQMPKQFHLGDVKPFEKYTVSTFATIAAFIAMIAFIMLATETIFKTRLLTIVAGAGLTLLALAYLVLKLAIIVKAFALLTAIVAPIFAVLAIDLQSKKGLLKKYAQAALIASIGIIIVTALLNGNDYLLGINAFKGVKLVYIAPMAFIGIYALYGNYQKIAKQPILYIHAVLAVVLLAFVAYYMSRTGNGGTATDLELAIRQTLEQWLYARPRTKEFLIGFPFFVLALYMYPRQQLIGKLLLIPGVIGFLSMVNTFTHFHIPIYVSVIRSVLGLALGFVIGLLFIWIVKQAIRLYDRYLKQRWSM